MKRQLLLFIHLLPALLFAQQEVIFPDDFKTNALDGKEVAITNTLTLTNNTAMPTVQSLFLRVRYGLPQKRIYPV